jgi:uncharacterized membrane protein YdjX (TVP38/TMEM64 family)
MQPDTTPEIKTESRRLIIGACIVGVLVLLLYLTPLKEWLNEVREVKSRIDDYGWKSHAAFILGSIGAIAVGVPRLVLCGLGGFLFGFWEGLLASQFAGVLGSYGAFLITRTWAPKAWVQSKLAHRERLRAVLEKPSIGSIFVARQLPVPGLVPNVLLGVLPTRHTTFLIGTFLGYLPSNIPVALAGSSPGKGDLAMAGWQLTASMVALAVFSSLIMWIRRKVD